MEPSETPTPPRGERQMSGDEIRRATFPPALRGYDRDSVHALLDRVADWVEKKGGAVADATPAMKDELAKVGERTAGILTAAEEAARDLRDEATEYADRLRADAEEEARKARLNASQRMDEMVAEAEQKAQAIMDDAVARRRQLNQAIASLIDRRDEIAAEAAKLGEELLGAVESIRTATSEEEDAETTGDDPEPTELDPEPISEEEPTLEDGEEPTMEDGEEPTLEDGEPMSEEAELEPESDEIERRTPPRLLVDPDAEDDGSEEATRIQRLDT